MTLDGLVLRVGEGGKLSFRGTELTFKARGERPAGEPTVFEFREAPGFSTGDHIHSKIEEIFYVIEGEFEIRVGDRMLKARPGDFMLVPPKCAAWLWQSWECCGHNACRHLPRRGSRALLRGTRRNHG